MQVMPYMYEELALPGSVSHVEANIEAGCRLLADNIRTAGRRGRHQRVLLGQHGRQRPLPATGRSSAATFAPTWLPTCATAQDSRDERGRGGAASPRRPARPTSTRRAAPAWSTSARGRDGAQRGHRPRPGQASRPRRSRWCARARPRKSDGARASRGSPGIQAAKRTSEWIPLCHPLPLDALEIDFALEASPPAIAIEARARTTARTGVEMEALVAVSAAALAIYDMCKSIDRGMVVGAIRLVRKTGRQERHLPALRRVNSP